eukprot:CAMPEP_0115856152 /NCGR_PEP_ID=MMETSP0287-20121206/14904_1 /TAXON_ID=412157 /ORGANISM="Chrysochromulina rotalis, Strain UIO044" /LENGTH=205 /DNA_ID=CAMNT_0003310315 /DNA_START=314 /DNA_END=932 /DNA_ORIENTATION=+
MPYATPLMLPHNSSADSALGQELYGRLVCLPACWCGLLTHLATPDGEHLGYPRWRASRRCRCVGDHSELWARSQRSQVPQQRDLSLDLGVILWSVALERTERLLLGRIEVVRVVEQRLDADEQVLDCQGRLPGLFGVEERQADLAGRVYVRMEQRLPRLWDQLKLADGRLVGVVLGESHRHGNPSTFPQCPILAGDDDFPVQDVL